MADYSGGGGGGGTKVITYNGRSGVVRATSADVPQVPFFIGTPSTAAPGGTSVTVTKPAGNLITGDLLVAAIQGNGWTTAPTAPTGWTLVLSPSGTAAVWVYTYTCLGGASDPASFTFGGETVVENCNGIIFAVRSFSGTVGIDQAQYNGQTTLTLPSVTTTGLNELVIGFFCTNSGGSAITVPVAMLPVAAVNLNNDVQAIGAMYQVNAGATPTGLTATNAGATSSAAAIMTLYSHP